MKSFEGVVVSSLLFTLVMNPRVEATNSFWTLDRFVQSTAKYNSPLKRVRNQNTKTALTFPSILVGSAIALPLLR